MYEEEENRWRCSFRSVRKRTNDVEKFRQEILERIVMMRKFSGQDK